MLAVGTTHKTRWLNLLPVVVLMILGTGCGSATPTPAPQQFPGGRGAVVGGINPCFGIPPTPGGPTYVAGTVTVLRGQVTWKPTGPGSSVPVLPTAQVTEQTLATNATYRFLLDPGSYVLEAHYAGEAVNSPGGC
jgi:hypothetical protein